MTGPSAVGTKGYAIGVSAGLLLIALTTVVLWLTPLWDGRDEDRRFRMVRQGPSLWLIEDRRDRHCYLVYRGRPVGQVGC